MAHLTDLAVSLPMGQKNSNPAGVLMALADCAHFTRLAITELPPDGELLQRFILQLKSAPRLRCLSLAPSHLAWRTRGDHSPVFAVMPQLEEFIFSCLWVKPPVAFFQHAHHAASLRLL